MRYEISAAGKLIGELRAPPSFDLFAGHRRDRAASPHLQLYRRHNSPLRLSVPWIAHDGCRFPNTPGHQHAAPRESCRQTRHGWTGRSAS